MSVSIELVCAGGGFEFSAVGFSEEQVDMDEEADGVSCFSSPTNAATSLLKVPCSEC